MKLLAPRLRLLLASTTLAFALPFSLTAQTTPPPTVSTTPTTTSLRERPFATFDTASPAVRDAVAAATATAQTAAASLDEAIRLGIVQPAGIATSSTPVLPSSVAALPTAVQRAQAAIVAESRDTRSAALARREDALARLRRATTDAERQRIIEELRTLSSQRLDAQREDARLVRDRLRQLREFTTLNRPTGN